MEPDEKRRTNQEGIDFLFNNVELTVYFRYHRYQFGTSEPLHLRPTYFTEVLSFARVHEEKDDDADDAITEGSLFEWGWRLFKVREIRDNGAVSGICLAPARAAGTTIEIEDLHAVSLAIHAYKDDS